MDVDGIDAADDDRVAPSMLTVLRENAGRTALHTALVARGVP